MASGVIFALATVSPASTGTRSHSVNTDMPASAFTA